MDFVNRMRLIKYINSGTEKKKEEKNHCAFIFRSLFTGQFVYLRRRSYRHREQTSLHSHQGESGFFTHFSLLQPSESCAVHEVPSKTAGKDIHRQRFLTLRKNRLLSGRSEIIFFVRNFSEFRKQIQKSLNTCFQSSILVHIFFYTGVYKYHRRRKKVIKIIQTSAKSPKLKCCGASLFLEAAFFGTDLGSAGRQP